MTATADRTGVIVVRIWLEQQHGSLRARITQTLDVTTHEQVSRGAATLEQILAIVRDGVEAFLAAPVDRRDASHQDPM